MMASATLRITFDVDPVQLERLDILARTFPGRIVRAVARSVNRAAKHAVTISKRVISRELGIRQADLVKPHRFGARGSASTGRAIDIIKRATFAKPSAIVRITGKRIPVVWFKAKPTPLTAQRPVWYRDAESGQFHVSRFRGQGVGWKIGAKKSFVERAFMGKTKSGHLGVFWRRPDKSRDSGYVARLPIDEIMGPSIPYVASKNRALKRALEVDVSATLQKRIEGEIKALLAGKSTGGGVR
jgi:hypothetical protein